MSYIASSALGRRVTWTVAIGALVLGFVAVGPVGAFQSVEEDEPEEEGEHAGYTDGVGPDSPDMPDLKNPCEPITDGGVPEVDELAAAGLNSPVVPTFLLDDFDLGGLFCISDPLAGIVEGVYTEFWSDGAVVARWLIPGAPTAADETWEHYMASLPGGGEVFETPDGAFVSVPATEHADGIIAQVISSTESESVSLWETFVPILNHVQASR